LLAPGSTFDPSVHRSATAPRPSEPVSLDGPAGSLRRRLAEDSTEYCSCCDTVLAPPAGRGRPAVTCEPCRAARRRLKRAAFEATRTRDRPRRQQGAATTQPRPMRHSSVTGSLAPATDAGGGRVPDGTTVVHLPAPVATALHQLADAVGRAPPDIPPRYRNTWEGNLLQAAQQISRWHNRRFDTNT